MYGGVHTSPRSVELIVVAASLGGLRASRELFASLPGDLPAPVVLVQHRARQPNILADLLQRHTALHVTDAVAGARPAAGTVYVAPPDRQLTFCDDGSFGYDADRSGSRADPLFASAAAVYTDRLVAVVLSGRLDDGARGAIAVKAAGGRVFVQDRATADAFDMPAAALASGCVDFVLPPTALAAALITLTMLPAAADLFRVDRSRPARSAA